MFLMEQAVTTISLSFDKKSPAFDTSPEEKNAPLVLIVEDDPAFSYLCASHLEAGGEEHYGSVQVESIEEALSAMQSQLFHCVLIDYRLPDGTGVDLVARICQEFPDWLGATILMTADGSEDIVADGLRAGANDYISKQNINAESLNRIIERAYEKVALRKELRRQNLELSNTNQLLQDRNAEITDFYHKVSHEIKTPLTAARMFMSMLDEGLAGPLTDEQAELVSQAIASCNELTKHFNDLIECTRLEAHKISLTYSEEELSRLITRSVASLSAIAEEKQVELKIQCDPVLPSIQVDAGRVVQVLANLIGNAIKFTEKGGRVAVNAQLSSEANDFIEICVSDTGIGIREEHLPKIYERLYQVNSTGDASTGAGLGLGLSITKEIVALHGGTIEVQSNYGTGTVFTVKLPISPIKDQIGEDSL